MAVMNLLRNILLPRFRGISSQIFVRQCNSFSADELHIFGIKSSFTDTLEFTNNEHHKPIPIYRILDPHNHAELKPMENKLDNETLIKMYQKMVSLSVMDQILHECQRQGRISFYMPNLGEEAIQIGSACALTLQDTVYAQYREAGVLLWRGFEFSHFLNQCYGNWEDNGKGKQMPAHYGSRELNFITISSPLATQLPQAVGAAYGIKQKKKEACVICYFGEGASSEGDAHAAMNFAATLQCPVIFFCRNNGYAISTRCNEQFKGDGVAGKGPAYGINTIRVDGCDILAVYHATKAARDYCLKEKKPVLIEALAYRLCSHSTSDDGSGYRSNEEVSIWNNYKPTKRFRQYIESLELWNEEKEKEFTKSAKEELLDCIAKAEKKQKPHWKELFIDVYHTMPNHIRDQMHSMEKHIEEYREHYPLNTFKS